MKPIRLPTFRRPLTVRSRRTRSQVYDLVGISKWRTRSQVYDLVGLSKYSQDDAARIVAMAIRSADLWPRDVLHLHVGDQVGTLEFLGTGEYQLCDERGREIARYVL